jgi:hypothetical protein
MLSPFSQFVRRAISAAAVVVSLFAANSSLAVEPYQYAVDLSSSVQAAPPQIRLNWSQDLNANGYTIARKAPGATSWTALTSLPATANGYTDGNVTLGSAFEYRVVKNTKLGFTAYGYALAGVDAPIVEDRGKLILVVDLTHAAALAPELTRLQQDLTGDGWTVIRKDVSRTATPPSVKSIIKTEYDADKANVKAVFLFGHVPVPRSGNMNPDGHDNHEGAWAADAYYADMDGAWTDSSVNNTSAERADNHNVPGDGRFDQSQIPSDLELAVGRVDLSNLTCFSNKTPSRSELDLLRAYLDKDHNFRHGKIIVPRRGLVADNFGDIYGEAFAASAWRNFAPMFMQQNITPVWNGQYFPTLSSQAYLFSYACGGGSYYTCAGVGSSDDFALNNIQAVFTMHFGSYFGDWDNESNFLRASLGSGYVLTTSWSGRPHWFYHRMALGEPIGASARLSQNNSSLYQSVNQNARGANNALLGDPTLRLHPVLPPSSVTAANDSGLKLTWTGSSDSAIQGYHVYRATNAAGPFTRLNSTLLGATTFTDATPITNAVYMVRAVKLESTPSGTYYNPSQGAFYTNGTQIVTPPPAPSQASKFVKIDATTSGNWKGVYGAEGSWVYSGGKSIPAYLSASPLQASEWIWQTGASGPVEPYVSATSSDRIAACWYSFAPWDFDLSVNDGKLHRVAAYFMDWGNGTRQQRVDLIDLTTGATIDTRTLSNFQNGVYLVWDVVGNVRIRVTPIVGNAVVSALFFDPAATSTPAPAPVATNAARFIKVDSTTRGNWNGVYGADASIIARDSARSASYATVAVSKQSEFTFNTTMADQRALLKNDGSARIAGVWYSYYPTTNAFFIDINITDGATHQVALYALDWWKQGRAMQVEVLDGSTGTVLNTQQLQSYGDGKYLVWDIKGRIRLKVSTLTGPNAMVSGVFLQPASAPL